MILPMKSLPAFPRQKARRLGKPNSTPPTKGALLDRSSPSRRHGRRLAIPKSLLLDLLSAFPPGTSSRAVNETWDELNDYCRRSRQSGRPARCCSSSIIHDEGLAQLSDHVCTALRLANHWQDVAVDLAKDRIYVPRELSAAWGSPRTTSSEAGSIRRSVLCWPSSSRARRGLSQSGRPLCDAVGRRSTLRAAPDLAGRIVDPRSHRSRSIRRLSPGVHAMASWKARARPGGPGAGGLRSE